MWQAWYNRGVLHRRERDYERAAEDQTQALKLFPNCPEVLHERALALASLRRFEAALADVNRLSTAHGDKGEVSLLRGKILGDMGRLKESEEELTRALKEAPDEADGYRSRAVTRMRAQDWQGAIDDFQKYLRRAPAAADLASVHNDMSVAWLNLGKKDNADGALKSAQEALNRSVALRPTPSVLTNRGFFYLNGGVLTPALRDFSAALRKDPEFPRAWALRGQTYLRLGRLEEAEADFVHALKIPPVYYETRLLLAGDPQSSARQVRSRYAALPRRRLAGGHRPVIAGDRRRGAGAVGAVPAGAVLASARRPRLAGGTGRRRGPRQAAPR